MSAVDSGVSGLAFDEAVVPDSGVKGLRVSVRAPFAANNALPFPVLPSVAAKSGAVKTTGGSAGEGGAWETAVEGTGETGAVAADLYSVGGGFHENRLKLLVDGFLRTLAL